MSEKNEKSEDVINKHKHKPTVQKIPSKTEVDTKQITLLELYPTNVIIII